MKEYPILFNAAMVKALLSKGKTQTRRPVIPRTPPTVIPQSMDPWYISGELQRYDDGRPLWAGYHPKYPTGYKWFACDYGQPGDRLWVRETWGRVEPYPDASDSLEMPEVDPSHNEKILAYWRKRICYRADNGVEPDPTPEDAEKGHCRGKWRPSIHMPRWASRITLEVTDVTVERLQDIDEADSDAEGVAVSHYYCDEGTNVDPTPVHRCNPIAAFQELWNETYTRRGLGWDVNPWVWAVSFKVFVLESELVTERKDKRG